MGIANENHWREIKGENLDLLSILTRSCANFKSDLDQNVLVVFIEGHCLDFQITWNRETREVLKIEARDN